MIVKYYSIITAEMGSSNCLNYNRYWPHCVAEFPTSRGLVVKPMNLSSSIDTVGPGRINSHELFQSNQQFPTIPNIRMKIPLPLKTRNFPCISPVDAFTSWTENRLEGTSTSTEIAVWFNSRWLCTGGSSYSNCSPIPLMVPKMWKNWFFPLENAMTPVG